MAAAVITHELIVTTRAKEMDLRRVRDKAIRVSMRGELNSRRRAACRLREEGMVKRLVDTLAPR